MKYKEAQDLSVSGVAVFGNEVMQDVIWPKDSSIPFMWIKNGYKPMMASYYHINHDGWKPLHKKYEEPNADSDSDTQVHG